MIADGVYVMSRPRAGGFAYAPLLLCSFQPDLTRRLVEAQRLYRQYPAYADADTATARLRWCRLRAGLTWEAFCRKTGISSSSLSVWLQGKKRVSRASWEKYFKGNIE